MKAFRLTLSLLLFATAVFLCRQIISVSVINQQSKLDYAEINHIKYGLFSVNAWKEKLQVIISEEIAELDLSKANEKVLKKHVELQLAGLIDNVAHRIKESNRKTLKGRIKQSFINTLVDMEVIKAGIPGYADAIIEQMTKSKTERALKGAVKKRIEGFFENTFEDQDLSRVEEVLRRTGAPDIESARLKIELEIISNTERTYRYTWLLIAVATILFTMAGFTKGILPAPQYFLLLFTLMVLLLAGVTTPMIDMEAKISEMSFMLLGHPVKFMNQVLYFQSKSILDVFWIMITHKQVQMKAVGVLMVAFSVVFPLLKMFSSLEYYYNFRGAREKRLIRFFVLKSGKWSMTDVLVVAIFMAYIGFNGIITSQFGHLSAADQDMVVLTTNGTALQPGFYIFLAYTILALFLSEFLFRKTKGVA